MPEVLVISPLASTFVSQTYDFADGISIRRELPIDWDDAIINCGFRAVPITIPG